MLCIANLFSFKNAKIDPGYKIFITSAFKLLLRDCSTENFYLEAAAVMAKQLVLWGAEIVTLTLPPRIMWNLFIKTTKLFYSMEKTTSRVVGKQLYFTHP
jgi:hypothetical protein